MPELPTRLVVGRAGQQIDAGVIIVGTGAAGMAAAVRLLLAGRRVTMITKGRVGDGSTAWAQGGLAAVTDPTDSLTEHLSDTLVAGAGLCEADQVAELVTAAPDAIERLIALGGRFDRNSDGTLALGLEGGHHRRRIVHAGGDASGAEVARTLGTALGALRSTTEDQFTLLEGTTAVDAMLDDSGAVCGLRVIDSSAEVIDLLSDAVVLATGGIGQAWKTTTNPSTATGDGLGIALRAGAVVRDPEFVQFHPTVLVVPPRYQVPGDRGVLISEAVRGEGARLINSRGELIMAGRHPLADLAPRDVVASAMHADLLDSGDDHLLLDGTGLGSETWRTHFPSILQLCQDRGVDPITEPIPVRPAEHYFCGGILATLDGITTVPGLYAVGEAASTGVQGANRLASNSLTEAFIAGDRLGRLLAQPDVQTDARLAVTAAALRYQSGFHDQDIARTGGQACVVTATHRAAIVDAVTTGAGVLRDAAGLATLLGTLTEIRTDRQSGTATDVECSNLLTVGALVGAAALTRTESRGCHRRADHDRPVESWQRHSYLALDGSGQLINSNERAAVAA